MPEAVADVRKIGTMTAEFHSSRDLLSASTKAVVVCRYTANGNAMSVMRVASFSPPLPVIRIHRSTKQMIM